MKHVNYLSFFLLTLFSISFISCSDDDDNKLNTGITNQSWTEGKSLEISQDNELSVSFNAAAKWVASVTSGADWCKLNTRTQPGRVAMWEMSSGSWDISLTGWMTSLALEFALIPATRIQQAMI